MLSFLVRWEDATLFGVSLRSGQISLAASPDNRVGRRKVGFARGELYAQRVTCIAGRSHAACTRFSDLQVTTDFV
jgi:hypothetical protein